MKSRWMPIVLLLGVLPCVGIMCGPDSGQPATPCSSGTDVRNLDDSSIPQNVKTAIYYQPGPIISAYDPANPSQPNSNFPSGKVVIIPFETPDYPRNPAITISYLTQVFFASGQLSGPSVYHYFYENSYGQFKISNGGIANWVTLTKSLTSYVGFEGDAALPRDVLAQANINWSSLDTNGDKTISSAEAQIVFLVANGYSAATRWFLNYPSNWKLGDPVPPEVNPLRVNTPSGIYEFKPRVVYIGTKTAAASDAAVDPIRILSTICHELCHAFFYLPDRYGNTGACGSGSTGQYDMMSDNCQWHHMTMHDKMKIGWVQPKIIATHLGQCVAFPNSENFPAALVLLAPATSQKPLSTSEYWIVENRNKPSSLCNNCVLQTSITPFADGVFDAGQPESGLAVW